MKITGKLRYELGLTEVLNRKMRQMKKKLRRSKMSRGKKSRKRRDDWKEVMVFGEDRGKDGQRSRVEGGGGRGYQP